MLTEEPQRLDLLRGLEQVLGDERAKTLMGYLPATRDVATREDIQRLERQLDERFAVMQRQRDERFTAVDERFAAMQRQMDERFTAVDERFAAMQRQMDERFTALEDLVQVRFDSLRDLIKERHTSLEHQVKGGDDSTAGALRAEMNRLMTSQTRIIAFGLIGALTANVSLVFLAT